MAENHQTTGSDYVPASSAGSAFGYTGDYVTKLARDGKIIGEKIGRRWFISLASLTDFVESKKIEKNNRSEAIRRERKEELRSNALQQVEKNYNEANESLLESDEGNRTIAFAQAALILVIGLVFGVGSYVAVDYERYDLQIAAVETSSLGFFEWLAVSVYEFISPGADSLVTYREDGWQGGTDSGVTLQETGQEGNYSGMVVAPTEEFNEEMVELVRDSFSDEVEVRIDRENPDTGIVVPQFREREGGEYRFLMVPFDLAGEGR